MILWELGINLTVVVQIYKNTYTRLRQTAKRTCYQIDDLWVKVEDYIVFMYRDVTKLIILLLKVIGT